MQPTPDRMFSAAVAQQTVKLSAIASMKRSSLREKFTARAESALGRSLKPMEHKAVFGFDETVMRLALESLTKPEIAGMVTNVCGMTSPVSLLERLGSGADSISGGWQTLLGFLKPRARKIISPFDFDAALKIFSDWLLAMWRNDPLPKKIRALNFGLFESGGGCRLYVTGMTRNSAADSDRAGANAWHPKGYAPIDTVSKIYGSLRAAGGEPWVVAQAIVILLIRAFFETGGEEVKTLIGVRRLSLTSGFDDGDLYTITTVPLERLNKRMQ